MSVATLEIVDGVGIITINSPPVNALGFAVREGIGATMRTCLDNSTIDAIVLMCVGRTFFAGADISEPVYPLDACRTFWHMMGHDEEKPLCQP